jgi:hypothetical protein
LGGLARQRLGGEGKNGLKMANVRYSLRLTIFDS